VTLALGTQRSAAKNIVVLGAGIGGLTAAALLAKAGHRVTVVERNDWIGGKSRRIELAGQRLDTGPALLTFPGVWDHLAETYNGLGNPNLKAPKLDLVKLEQMGEYFFRGQRTMVPVEPEHPWHQAWTKFDVIHGGLGPAIEKLLLTDPMSAASLPSVQKVFGKYGLALTTDQYLKSLRWMPEDLKEVIAIHTLNAGIAPQDTLALYASITAVMAREGISVPQGGVNQLPLTLHQMALAAGATFELGQQVTKVAKNLVETTNSTYRPDYVVSSLDPQVLKTLMTGKAPKLTKRSCSGVAIYAVLNQPLPQHTVTHSVVMPDNPHELHAALRAAVPPKQTMAFVNYYRPGQIYPNTKPTVAVLLTAPSDGKHYTIESDWVRGELDRISTVMGLEQPIDAYFEEHQVLDPQYFGSWGSLGGALYGATRQMWQSGPFHSPAYNNPFRPWLWRVGASVHPGGGMPAVLGGAMNSVARLIKRLG
jgi:phytoene desaturase